jgi:DNA-directed RNA polymerase sigma subunit (sigma70/sigma32)
MNDSKDNDRIASNYFIEVGKFPLPTKEEEVRLFKAYERARDLEVKQLEDAKALRKKKSPTWKELEHADELEKSAKAYEREKIQVCQAITVGYLRFVMRQARNRTRDSILMQELISEGNIGLSIAIRKFEVARGNRFLTFGAFWIKVFMDEFMNRSLTVHVPSHTRKEIRRKKREEDNLLMRGIIKQTTIEEPTVGPLDPNGHPDENVSTDATVTNPEHTLLKHMDLADLTQEEKLVLVFRFGLRETQARTVEEMTQLFYELDGKCLLAEELREVEDLARLKLEVHFRQAKITAPADVL